MAPIGQHMTEAPHDPPRKPGRPRAEEPGVRLSTWIPARTFDELAKVALKHDRSLSAILRENLQRFPPK